METKTKAQGPSRVTYINGCGCRFSYELKTESMDGWKISYCRLHAAAPELLEALKGARAELGRLKEHNCYVLCDQISAAIDKAEPK